MMSFKIKTTVLAASLMAMMSMQAQAGIIISEVNAAGSSATYAADWFELTNTGSSTVNISGWKIDDNSNAFSSAVALRGVTSIAAGQSVVFLEGNASGSNDAAIDASFISAWFGANPPAGLTIGNYGGSGVGLSSTSDAVNIFNGSGTLITRVDFGATTAGFTFDNAAGLNNTVLTQNSAIGVHGAFLSANGVEVGSPGAIAAVPEPDTLAMLLAGLGLVGFTVRRKQKSA